MKKMITVVCMALCFLVISNAGDAHYDEYKANIKEGIGIMVKSPQPLIDAVKDEYNVAKFKPFGVVGGFFKGGFYSLKEFSTGLLRVVTFNMEEDNIFTNLIK